MTKIDVEKIKIFFLSHLYFPENENNNKEKIYNIDNYKEIEIIELIQQNTDFNKKAHFIIERNEFKLEFEIVNKKLNDFQNKFDEVRKELKDEKRKIRITSEVKMFIYFNLSDIEFIFYKSNFSSIINNNEKPELYIYLKKFDFECEITRKYNDIEKEYLFPLFPYIDMDNIINNLKFHDTVFSFNLALNDLFNFLFLYENKIKIVHDIVIKNLNSESNFEDEDEDNYDLYISLETKNHDIIWHLLCLVSERFITYYNLIVFLNKYKKELNDIIKNDEYLFIILLRNLLKTKYSLSEKTIKFYNPESLYEYIKENITKKLAEEQLKEYNIFVNIYTTNEIRKKYFRYNLIITPLTCKFKIPFLKSGLFLIEKFENEFKSYDLINFSFQNYKKMSNKNIRIDNDITNYFLYYIINTNQYFFCFNYSYLGYTFDSMKYQKFFFINTTKLDIYKNKKNIFNINDKNDENDEKENNDLFINDILLNEDIAAYLCQYKSIKLIHTNLSEENNNNIVNINRGIISSSLKEKIRKECQIHNFNACYGIIGNFLGNFSVINSVKYNNKNRILIQKDKNKFKGEKKLLKDRILYILNISKFNPGILSNDNIDLLNLIKFSEAKNIIKSIIANIFNLDINNIHKRIPISKSKLFLEILNNNVNGTKLRENNEFIYYMKKSFLKYQYNLINKNILEIPNSAILSGITDEYNIMKHAKNNCICVIIEHEKYGGVKYLKGEGIIFKTRNKYINLNEGIKVVKIKFFDLEKLENSKKKEKIMKFKQLKNVIIFPKNAYELFKILNIEDISKQEFFICWDKNIIDNLILLDNNYNYINAKGRKKKENISEILKEEEFKNEIQNLFVKNLRNKHNIGYMHFISDNIFNNKNKSLINYIQTKNIYIDYKNLTENLINKKDLNLNESELFYIEYIPKCTLVIKNIINKIKEIMNIYSINNIFDLLVGNINIDSDSKQYLNEIENINNILLFTINNNLEKLIDDIKYLKNQINNKQIYFNKYKEKMLIITTIIYNICNRPKQIEKIIIKYNALINKLIKHKYKRDPNLQIKDCFDYDIIKLGIESYELFDSDILINNNNIIIDKDINLNLNEDDKDKKENNDYIYFFKDFKILLFNQNEIKKYYIPELLLYKYLRQLNINFI